MEHTIHINGAIVATVIAETLEPPKEIIVAVAPGIYYRYTTPELVSTNDD